ncbi:MAG: S8 family peptidase, partial [Acidimicrobiales bacterium]
MSVANRSNRPKRTWAILTATAVVALTAGGLAYNLSRGNRRVPVVPATNYVHPHWPDHYNHFMLTVAVPHALTTALRVHGTSRDSLLVALSRRTGTTNNGSAPVAKQRNADKDANSTSMDLPTNKPMTRQAVISDKAGRLNAYGAPLQQATPDSADPIVLRPGQPISLLLGRLAKFPKGTRLERDSEGNLRAVLPPHQPAPIFTPALPTPTTSSDEHPVAHGAVAKRYGPSRQLSNLPPGVQAGSQQVVKALLSVPGVHEASHVWGDKYQVATSLNSAQVSALPGVSGVVRNNLLAFDSAPATNDPDLADEYYVENYGQVVLVPGTPGASGDFAYAWARSQGNGVVIADIDTGVDLDNPDLAGQILPTSMNFAADPPNYDVQAEGTADDFYHGTTVDGEIAGVAGNGLDGAGAAPGVKILALKCSDSSFIPDSCIYAAGEYAISQHVQIINMSFGYNSTSDTILQSLVAKAQAAGILVTAAAGNNSSNDDTDQFLPAGFSTTYNNVISVGATTNQDQLASFSNYGAKTVDIMAPGEFILTDYPTYAGSQVTLISGTSYAAPLVAAEAALVWSIDPTLTYLQVKSIILESAQQVPALAGLCATGARLDAQAAVAMVHQQVQWSFAGFDQVQPGQPANMSVSVSAQPGALPSGVPLGYHLALAYDYNGTAYYVTKQDLTWSTDGSSPQTVTTDSNGSVLIAPSGTNSTNYGASPIEISVPSPGLAPGYYALVAYAASTQAPSSPIGGQQAVFWVFRHGCGWFRHYDQGVLFGGQRFRR